VVAAAPQARVFLGVLAFPTHSWRETAVVLGVVAAVAYWVAG
jgi:hypothetical protein